jgi:hypothetical protein
VENKEERRVFDLKKLKKGEQRKKTSKQKKHEIRRQNSCQIRNLTKKSEKSLQTFILEFSKKWF